MTDLHNSLDHLSIAGGGANGGAAGGGANGAAQGQPQQQQSGQVRKQRSQRFTVQTTNSSPAPPVPALPSSAAPALPYQAPPPPVQSQTVLPTPLDAHFSFNRNPPVERTQSAASSGASSNPYSEESDVGAYGAPSAYLPPQVHSHAPAHAFQALPPHLAGYPSAMSSPYTSAYTQQQPAYATRPRAPEAIGGGGGAGMRAGLPTEWMGRSGAGAGGYGDYSGGLQGHHGGYAALVGRAPSEDEVIPTAIVIKNIPFHIPKEALLGVMEDLQLPPPFAFNYHFDNGQFRGLAFANFRVPADAALTVSALNGFDLQGRKLRAEFKKVLKEGEKERIEREKALKRMRSQRELSVGPPIGTWNRREASAPGGYPVSGGEEDDYGRLLSQGPFSNAYGVPPVPAPRSSFGAREYVPAPESSYGHAPVYGSSPPSDVGTSVSARMTVVSSASGSEFSSKYELDLNDPQALEIYSRVLLFVGDSLRDELAFARSLSPTQRRTVHLVAKKLGLEHRSVGVGEDRHVVVFKAGAAPSLSVPQAEKPLRHSSSTVGRASRDFDVFLSPGSGSNNVSSSLRGKKSMPDIRPSNTHIREGYASVGRSSKLYANAPPVPTLHYQSESKSSTSSPSSDRVQSYLAGGSAAEGETNGQAHAVRQPKGPPEDDVGFGWKAARQQAMLSQQQQPASDSQTAVPFEP